MKKNKLKEALKAALKAENVRYGTELMGLDNREDLYCDRHEITYEGTYNIPMVMSELSRRDLQTDMHMLKMEHEARKTTIRQKYLTGEL